MIAMSLDYSEIAGNLIVMVIGGAFSWAFASILKTKKDVNALFNKLRAIEKELNK